ncbi:PRAME family member 12-like [Marmota flaviventris]|uniref:PRAME family member 12-like n=1 Tax=Marmota flaviventris TaxID=93162 RepID=UPI003A865AD3
MSIQSLPMLLELAGSSLLSDKSRAILDLEDMPIELFPPLFVEAFSRGHTEVLKKMVQAWPFTCLPLGALRRKPQMEMIQVALDGLNVLLAQQDHPRRWKLQVLDLRRASRNFWRMWSGALVDGRSPEAMKKNQTSKHGPAMAAKPPFQMKNLRKLLVSQVRVPAHTSPEEQERLLTQLTSQFLRMDCLRNFCVDAVLLLKGHMEQALDFSPESLKILLEITVASLKSLDLEACGITDSQLQALLPALSCCSQLRVLSFHGNRNSMSAQRDLLLHTARLSQLSVELYPAPLKSYDAQGAIHPGRCPNSVLSSQQ